VVRTALPREMKVLLVLRKDNPIEIYDSSLPSASLRKMLVEQLEHSSETDCFDRLSTMLEVSSTSVSDAGSSEGWVVRTVTPSVFRTDSLDTPRPAPRK